MQLAAKSGWACGEVISGNVTVGEGAERLQVAGGEAAMLTSPVNRLRRGSAHSPLPPEADVDGSKVKRPLYASDGRRGVSGRLCRSGRSSCESEREERGERQKPVTH